MWFSMSPDSMIPVQSTFGYFSHLHVGRIWMSVMICCPLSLSLVEQITTDTKYAQIVFEVWFPEKCQSMFYPHNQFWIWIQQKTNFHDVSLYLVQRHTEIHRCVIMLSAHELHLSCKSGNFIQCHEHLIDYPSVAKIQKYSKHNSHKT